MSEQQQRDAAAFEEAQQLLNAGCLKEEAGNARGALELYEECYSCAELISVARSAKAVKLVALGSIGNVCSILGKYERAIETLTQALSISRERNDRQNESAALGGISNAFEKLGQYKRSIEHRKRALDISVELRDREAEGIDLAGLGVALEGDGQCEDALKYFNQSLTICRELGDRRGEAARLSSLGLTHTRLGQHEQAVEHLKHALTISRELGDRSSEGGQLCNLGIVMNKLDQHEKAIQQFMSALLIVREGEDREAEGSVLVNLGLTQLLHLNNPAAALPWLQQSRAVHDALWNDLDTDDHRISYADTFSTIGRALQLAHARLEQPEAAIEEAERARSRSFEVLLAQQRVTRGVVPVAITASAPINCNALIAAAERQRVTIVFFSMIISRSAQPLAWVVRGGEGITMKQIMTSANDAWLTQLIELTRRTIGARARRGEAPVRSAQHVDSFVLQPQFVDEAALAAALGHHRDLHELSDDDVCVATEAESATVDQVTELLRRCHDLLIRPLGLVDGEPLLLVPDGDLYALPFSALIDENGKHLIERHSLRVAPSVGTVTELERRGDSRANPSGRALVVGNPAFNGWAKQLPAAEVEARHVTAALDASASCTGGVATLVGDQATKVTVVEAMRGCDIVHLATHGTSDGVLLGGASKAEGELSMGEVQGLDLSARLVVLSECDSFRGKLTADGVIGITRAFVAAGALTLVSSLWAVDDAATCELMERFYQRLLEDSKVGDAAVAMQGAMISMIRDGRWSVKHWAPFVVYGMP